MLCSSASTGLTSRSPCDYLKLKLEADGSDAQRLNLPTSEKVDPISFYEVSGVSGTDP
jgi:hypothetical protein